MNKKVTCGVLILTPDLKYILLGHSTHSTHWDIFKGLQNSEDEFPVDTALRELKEETSLNHIHELFLTDLGRQEYTKEKDINIFVMFSLLEEIKVDKMKCVSMVTQMNGKDVTPFPEMDKFAWIPTSEMHEYLPSRLNKIIQNIVFNTQLE